MLTAATTVPVPTLGMPVEAGTDGRWRVADQIVDVFVHQSFLQQHLIDSDRTLLTGLLTKNGDDCLVKPDELGTTDVVLLLQVRDLASGQPLKAKGSPFKFCGALGDQRGLSSEVWVIKCGHSLTIKIGEKRWSVANHESNLVVDSHIQT